jgi:hypothetical protein
MINMDSVVLGKWNNPWILWINTRFGDWDQFCSACNGGQLIPVFRCQSMLVVSGVTAHRSTIPLFIQFKACHLVVIHAPTRCHIRCLNHPHVLHCYLRQDLRFKPVDDKFSTAVSEGHTNSTFLKVLFSCGMGGLLTKGLVGSVCSLVNSF